MPIPTDAPIARRSLLRDDVYRAIRDAIVRGQLAPGEQLRDQELGTWLQVSRTPVREALQRLAQAGLVIAEPGRMTRVAPEDPAAVAHARQIAAELHALAMRLAAPAITDADLAAMEAANERLREALDDADSDAAIAADDDFHTVALAACNNPLIAEHLELVTATLRRTEHLHFDALTGKAGAADGPAGPAKAQAGTVGGGTDTTPSTPTASPDVHARIIAALREADHTSAVELTRENWLALSS